jgi:hypothetical protein
VVSLRFLAHYAGDGGSGGGKVGKAPKTRLNAKLKRNRCILLIINRLFDFWRFLTDFQQLLNSYCLNSYCLNSYCLNSYCLNSYCLNSYCLNSYWMTAVSATAL